MPVDFLIFAKRGYQYAGLGPLTSSKSRFTDHAFVLAAAGIEPFGNAVGVCGNAAAPVLFVVALGV
jgi:hypothetical protein